MNTDEDLVLQQKTGVSAHKDRAKRHDHAAGRDREMGIVEMMIIGLVFVSLGGCLVYSLISNRK